MSADRPVRVRTTPEFPGLVISDDGRIQGPSRKWLKPATNKAGYAHFQWTWARGCHKTVDVHVVVCTAFHGPRPTPQHYARHLNGNPRDNHAGNLAWGTPAQNQADALEHGTRVHGVRHPLAKLTENDVRRIRRLRQEGWLLKDITAEYPVTIMVVQGICAGKKWRHVQ